METRRKTPIEERLDLTNEDLIKPEDMVVTISRLGYKNATPRSLSISKKRWGWKNCSFG